MDFTQIPPISLLVPTIPGQLQTLQNVAYGPTPTRFLFITQQLTYDLDPQNLADHSRVGMAIIRGTLVFYIFGWFILEYRRIVGELCPYF